MSASTPAPTPPRTPEAVLRRLEWTVIRRLDGLLHGDYRSLFRGFGLDLADLAPDVLRHRLSLSYEALSDALSADELIVKIMRQVRAPDKPLDTHVRIDPRPGTAANA